MKGKSVIKTDQIKQNETRYNYYCGKADFYKKEAVKFERLGDQTAADTMSAAAREAERKAEEIRKNHPGRLKAATQPQKNRKKAGKKKTVNSKGKAFINALADSMKGVTLQYVTTEDELKAWIHRTRLFYTDENGLNKVEYCKALNTMRDNMLFTISELEKDIEDARKEGNEKAIPGYETIIDKYTEHAGIIAQEIQANGGKVN